MRKISRPWAFPFSSRSMIPPPTISSPRPFPATGNTRWAPMIKGRDMLAMLVSGARVSLQVGLMATLSGHPHRHPDGGGLGLPGRLGGQPPDADYGYHDDLSFFPAAGLHRLYLRSFAGFCDPGHRPDRLDRSSPAGQKRYSFPEDPGIYHGFQVPGSQRYPHRLASPDPQCPELHYCHCHPLHSGRDSGGSRIKFYRAGRSYGNQLGGSLERRSALLWKPPGG